MRGGDSSTECKGSEVGKEEQRRAACCHLTTWGAPSLGWACGLLSRPQGPGLGPGNPGARKHLGCQLSSS